MTTVTPKVTPAVNSSHPSGVAIGERFRGMARVLISSLVAALIGRKRIDRVRFTVAAPSSQSTYSLSLRSS
jgi:hypothetical protein